MPFTEVLSARKLSLTLQRVMETGAFFHWSAEVLDDYQFRLIQATFREEDSLSFAGN